MGIYIVSDIHGSDDFPDLRLYGGDCRLLVTLRGHSIYVHSAIFQILIVVDLFFVAFQFVYASEGYQKFPFIPDIPEILLDPDEGDAQIFVMEKTCFRIFRIFIIPTFDIIECQREIRFGIIEDGAGNILLSKGNTDFLDERKECEALFGKMEYPYDLGDYLDNELFVEEIVDLFIVIEKEFRQLHERFVFYGSIEKDDTVDRFDLILIFYAVPDEIADGIFRSIELLSHSVPVDMYEVTEKH